METYNGKQIIRVYSSGHVFLSDNKKQVYLVTTEKDWKIQHQFTGWSPLEEENKEVIFKKNWVYKFDIEKVRNNARIRTKKRILVKILEEYNEKPLVDWVLMENEENWEIYYKIVCLMHFIVKKYDWIISPTWQKICSFCYLVWYRKIARETPKVAPNAYIVSKKAVEILNNL